MEVPKRKRGRPKRELPNLPTNSDFLLPPPPPKIDKGNSRNHDIAGGVLFSKANVPIDVFDDQRKAIANEMRLRELELPHIHGQKHYKWSREFYESRNRINLLVAANQIGKSSTQIKKNIEWACNKSLWPKLWETEPKQFWYMYPVESVGSSEIYKKWIPEFLPRGRMREHEWYGWDLAVNGGEVEAIHFRSGVSIYFKTYGQKHTSLQTSTVHMISGDEEMPPDLADELMARLFATGGYFNKVFTATSGHEIWFRAMERRGTDEETFKTAAKWNISMYDCQFFEDGSPGMWPLSKIKEREAMCTSDRERARRVMGRFVRDEGIRYPTFSPTENMADSDTLPPGWTVYGCVDVGSGRTAAQRNNSCGAIVMLAVSPDFDQAKVIRSWRGDNQVTSSGDILAQYSQLMQGLPMVQHLYDKASKEFGLVAQRSGIPFMMCDKDRVRGEGLVNLLFKSKSLEIVSCAYDNQKLVTELMTVPMEKKRGLLDDLSDALKYVCLAVPWNYGKLVKKTKGFIDPKVKDSIAESPRDDRPPIGCSQKEYLAWEIRQRRRDFAGGANSSTDPLSDEIAIWNEAYG